MGTGRNTSGLQAPWKPGESGNPAGFSRKGREEKEFREALERAAAAEDTTYFDHIAARAMRDNKVLVATLDRIMAKKTEHDLSITGPVTVEVINSYSEDQVAASPMDAEEVARSAGAGETTSSEDTAPPTRICPGETATIEGVTDRDGKPIILRAPAPDAQHEDTDAEPSRQVGTPAVEGGSSPAERKADE